MGFAHPTEIITNAFIEELDIGTNSEWILEKIGIHERKTTLPLDYIRETRNEDFHKAREVCSASAGELAYEAAQMALDRAGIKASEVGLILSNCCTPIRFAPTEGQELAGRLGIQVQVHEAFTACPAFALHCDYLNRFDENELPKYTLCVSTATLTQKVNYNERSDAAIWGDGAAAWIISPSVPGKLTILDTHFTADPLRCQSVVVDTHGHFHQDGRAVRDFSVRQTVRLIKRMEQEFDIDWEKDIFVGHQANRTMLAQITRNRKIPDSNHWHNVERIGNQAGAGAPATLAMHWDQILPDKKIAMAVVGAGLSWGSVLLQTNDVD